jgi:hypothetical protein
MAGLMVCKCYADEQKLRPTVDMGGGGAGCGFSLSLYFSFSMEEKYRQKVTTTTTSERASVRYWVLSICPGPKPGAAAAAIVRAPLLFSSSSFLSHFPPS